VSLIVIKALKIRANCLLVLLLNQRPDFDVAELQKSGNTSYSQCFVY
jgi:hypothetical protein